MIEALETLVKTCSAWNEQQKTQVLSWLECARDFGTNLDECSEKLDYAMTIIKDLLDNSDEYARQRAMDFLKEVEK